MEHDEVVQKNDELFAKLKKCPEDSKEYRDIVSEIIKNHEYLVNYVAKKYFPVMKKFMLDRDDLMAEGRLGVLRAIKSFDPAKGAFSTYAAIRIKSRILTRFRDEKKRCQICSLQDKKTSQDGKQQKLEDILAAPLNLEEDLIEKDERAQQLAWVKENLNQVTPFQRKILTLRYLSGPAPLRRSALAEKLDRPPCSISDADYRGIAKLREIYYESAKEETVMRKADKITLKDSLKDLILTKLNQHEQEAMLCRFYSGTKKNNRRVAQEIGTTKGIIDQRVHRAAKKLCALCDRVKDKRQLKRILELDLVESTELG